MKSGRKFLIMMLIAACGILSVEGGCSTGGCSECSFILNTTLMSYVQSCTLCDTGYKTIVQGAITTCNLDQGLILGVIFGALAIIIAQIICFCVCGIYFKRKYKKPVQYTLNQIFEDLKAQKNDPEKVQDLQKKLIRYIKAQNDQPQLDCLYCRDYPQDKLQFKKYQKWLKQKERNAEERRRNPQPVIQSNEAIQMPQNNQEYPEKNPKGPTFLLEDCKHYYHLPCLKKQFKKTGRCNCNHQSLQIRVQTICKVCKLKQRKLTLRYNDIKQKGIDDLNEYICAVCYKQIYDQAEELKWINKLL